jgi:hypothetical protein
MTKRKILNFLYVAAVLFCGVPARCEAALFCETDRVLIMPVTVSCDTRDAGRTVGEIFYLAMVRNTSAVILHPRLVPAAPALRENFFSRIPDDLQAVQAARDLGADWVICTDVFDYNGYYPFSLGFGIQIIRVSNAELIVARTLYYDGYERYRRAKKEEERKERLIDKLGKRIWPSREPVPTMESFIRGVFDEFVIEGFN